jgi:hypothetical protein
MAYNETPNCGTHALRLRVFGNCGTGYFWSRWTAKNVKHTHSELSEDEGFEWTWSAMPKWGALAGNRVVWRRLATLSGGDWEQGRAVRLSGGASRYR